MSGLLNRPLKLAGSALALSIGLAALHLSAGWAEATNRSEIEWSADGALVPTLRLPTNRVVTVSFLDSNGVPWPVSELKVGITGSLSYGRGAQHPHVVFMEIEEDNATGNLVALLDGLLTPVHLEILSSSEASATDLLVRVAQERGAAPSAAEPDAPRGAALDAAIRDYLLANPQVLREALDPARQLAARVSDHREELLAAPGVPMLGDPSGTVTVVEFFDYRCGYCKRSLEAVRAAALLAGVRVQMREYPILGEESDQAARAALAAAHQGAYEGAHFALMAHEGGFDAESIEGIARDLGLDVERLRADMASEEVGALIDANRELAGRMGVTGTPAFLVVGPSGVQVSPGAVDADRLAGMIAEAG
ncbi:MAG: DsbA family protein [Gammaproteobacteria bacterium]|nr:DsbA family protein [Gammaproteobacteria bacterium]